MASLGPTTSYWEFKQYLNGIELLVVGSGIVGLSTAIFYKQKRPNARIVVVEKGFLPSGASTKNAGFACFGSLTEILADLKTMPETEVYELIKQRVDGLNELRALIGDEAMKYEPCGGYELFTDNDLESFERCAEFIPRINRRLEAELGLSNTYSIEGNEQFEFGNVRNLILNKHEGSIDTGLMMEALLAEARDAGIIILNGMEVQGWSELGNEVEVQFNQDLSLKTNKLHFAANGFAAKLFPDLDVKPARAQVLITEPFSELKINGTFHIEEGFYYFRNIDNRILLGGGRNLDLEGETTSVLETTALIQAKLESLLREVILPSQKVEIAHRWAGVMGVGKTKKVILKQISDRISCSVRLGGMGVAIGTSIGKQSAQMLA